MEVKISNDTIVCIDPHFNIQHPILIAQRADQVALSLEEFDELCVVVNECLETATVKGRKKHGK
jgi:hypothetical protein